MVTTVICMDEGLAMARFAYYGITTAEDEMEAEMRRVTFFFRDGGVIISQIDDNDTLVSIGQRMCGGGFITAQDSLWGKPREIVINLADVKMVVLEESKNTPEGQRCRE